MRRFTPLEYGGFAEERCDLHREQFDQVLILYAFRVVPRAPNFCALRRVSSNLERA